MSCLIYCYVVCRYVECRYAECRGAGNEGQQLVAEQSTIEPEMKGSNLAPAQNGGEDKKLLLSRIIKFISYSFLSAHLE